MMRVIHQIYYPLSQVNRRVASSLHSQGTSVHCVLLPSVWSINSLKVVDGIIYHTHIRLSERSSRTVNVQLFILAGKRVVYHTGTQCDQRINWNLQNANTLIAVKSISSLGYFGQQMALFASQKDEEVLFILFIFNSHFRYCFLVLCKCLLLTGRERGQSAWI